MKLYRNISVRIVFLLTVLCCYGTDLYPVTQTEHLYQAGMACPVSEASSHIADADPMSDEDQIHQIPNCISSPETANSLPAKLDIFVNTQFLYTVWQPPKTI